MNRENVLPGQAIHQLCEYRLSGVHGRPSPEKSRTASAALVAFEVWIGPSSSTRTTGFVGRPGLGPKRTSSLSSNALNHYRLKPVVVQCN